MKDIFCTKCATITSHTGVVDANGELLFYCTAVMTEDDKGNQVGHHFVKFPATETKQDFEQIVQEHQEASQPAAEATAQYIKSQELLAQLLDTPAPLDTPTTPDVPAAEVPAA